MEFQKHAEQLKKTVAAFKSNRQKKKPIEWENITKTKSVENSLPDSNGILEHISKHSNRYTVTELIYNTLKTV